MPLTIQPVAHKLKTVEKNNYKQIPAKDFTVQFWGVRGQIATPGQDTLRYGGNTPCLEIQVGGKRLIFDGGTGLRQLGNILLKQMPVEAHIFFTNCHWDRIQGFPFFVPAFIPGNCFHLYGAHTSNGSSFRQRLNNQMLKPNFPVPIEVMQSKLQFHNLVIEEKEFLEDLIIETNWLNYSHRSLGYRITYQDKSVVYATDTENGTDHLYQNLFKLSQKADLLILDAPSTNHLQGEEEFVGKQTFPWAKSLAIAKAAEVKQIVISTYNPDHNDQQLDYLEEQVKSRFSQVSLAYEGMILSLEKF